MNKLLLNKDRILLEFIEICKNLNLFYSLDRLSLYGTMSKEHSWNNLDHHEIMMKYQDYEILKNACPNRVLDNTLHSLYHDLQIKFVDDNKNIYENQPFLNINLIYPTNIANIKKYLKHCNQARSFIGHYLTMTNSNDWKTKNNIIKSHFLSIFYKPITYKEVANLLIKNDHQGFLISSPIIKKDSLKYWLPNIKFETKKVIINNIEVNVLVEFDQYLKNVYEVEYFEHSIPQRKIEYINPIEYKKIFS